MFLNKFISIYIFLDNEHFDYCRHANKYSEFEFDNPCVIWYFYLIMSKR